MSSQANKNNNSCQECDLKNSYLPRARSGYEPDKSELVSKAPDGSYTTLPNPVEDPIVCNNIAYSEFDYTEGAYLDD